MQCNVHYSMHVSSDAKECYFAMRLVMYIDADHLKDVKLEFWCTSHNNSMAGGIYP
jgi:hypothetical protein